MDVVDITLPALEPVSLARAKLFLRVEHDAEDELIADMIRSARQRVESYLGTSLISRQRQLSGAFTLGHDLILNHYPIQSIDAVRLIMAGGDIETLTQDQYTFNLRSRPVKIHVKTTALQTLQGQGACAAEVDVTAGYGPAETDIPTPLSQAILLLTAQSYEREERLSSDLPMIVQALLMPYRGLKL